MSTTHGGGGGDFKLPFLHSIEQFVERTNEGAGVYIPGWGLMGTFGIMLFMFFALAPSQTFANFNLLFFLSPIWLSILLARYAIFSFVKWRRATWATDHKWVLLEIRIPHDNIKTPAAMEAFFVALHIGPGEGTWFKRNVFGRTRDWWSFEVASIDGKIKFYAWTRERFRRPVESFLYAQYPNLEIIEAEDYSRLVNPSHKPWMMFACEYMQLKPTPYPIKTYVQYGLDRPNLPAEQFVDPFAQILELLGSLGKDEQYWFQIICRVSKKERYYGKMSWKDEGKQLVSAIQLEANRPGPGGEWLRPTPGQVAQMEAIERNVGKPGYDVGIRSIYLAKADKFSTGMQAHTANILRSYNSEIFNGFATAPLWSEKFNDYPWEDIGGRRQAREMHEVVEMYRRRSYFHPPYRGPWLIMSTEELATLFHIPTIHIQTPGLERKQSTSVRAPTNLPT